jgi:exopolyphosphatase/guanosine-5'-triphosphate,3'-diphosphate pyrophosphatase
MSEGPSPESSHEGDGADAVRAEFTALMFAHENKPAHVCHVSFLALQLFDQLGALHGLGPRERLLLETAAHLHDIGHAEDPTGTGHHKESARLIRAHPWKGLSPQEVEIVAQVARYHRKAIPEMEHDEFRVLAETDRRIVQHLAALLRLADSLDRSHARHVTGVKVELCANQLVLHLETAQYLPREIRAVQKKADLAMALYQRDVAVMMGDHVVPPSGNIPVEPGPAFPPPGSPGESTAV